MQSTVSTPLARRRITAAHLLDAPLPRLFEELDVELVETRIAARGFTGYVIPEGSHLVLALPAGRAESERDTMARHLLGAALRVPMPPPPEPYRLSEMPA